jgi:hypothetical protein
MSSRLFSALSLLALSAVVGCAEGEAPGHYFDISIADDRDECNEPDVVYKQDFEYRVVVDGSSATIFVDGGTFATGAYTGCDLVYSSTLLTDEREGGTVRWKIAGNAVISLGDGCDAGEGWVGEERIDITESEDEDLRRGCSYYTTVEGTYRGFVE